MAYEMKTILFIVEGSSDKAALENIFKVIYRRDKNVEFRFTKGDISSDVYVNIKNVEEKIYKIVQDFMRDKKLSRSDIGAVVQLFDTDGTYIPDDAVILGETNTFQYTTQNISCKCPRKVIDRNCLKKDIMDYLQGVKEIKSIPYEMYYMSCNLDHALYNQIMLSNELKNEYADQFYEYFMGKELLFVDFLEKDVANGVPETFAESWKYIKEGVRSLERHTNLHIYFKQHPRPDGLL